MWRGRAEKTGGEGGNPNVSPGSDLLPLGLQLHSLPGLCCLLPPVIWDPPTHPAAHCPELSSPSIPRLSGLVLCWLRLPQITAPSPSLPPLQGPLLPCTEF